MFQSLNLSKIFFDEKQSSKSWISSLDGLRGIAVLLVFIAHCKRVIDIPEDTIIFGFFPALSGTFLGRSGVYLFFVLSSFLLTSQLLRETFDLKNTNMWLKFALKRFLRIYPLYTVVLIVYLIRPSFKYDIHDLFSHLLLQEGSNHFWTIVVEFKYYLLLPSIAYLLVFVLKRNLRHSIIFFSCFIAGVELLSNNVSEDRLSILPHLPIFLIGSLAALINTKVPSTSKKNKVIMEIAAVISLGLIILSFPNILIFRLWNWLFDSDFYSLSANHWIYTLQAILWSIFLVTHLHGQGFFKKILEGRVLRFIGMVSFGIYLWHIAVLGYLEAHLPVTAFLKFIIIFMVTFAVSTVTYIVIEKPFSKLNIKSLKLSKKNLSSG